jgi:hypothetical protein
VLVNLPSTKFLTILSFLTFLILLILFFVNPLRQFQTANNITRFRHIESLHAALKEYVQDGGDILSILPTSHREIGNGESHFDLCRYLVWKYMDFIPVDPTSPNQGTACKTEQYATGYTIVTQKKERSVTISAPRAELSEIIEITKKY